MRLITNCNQAFLAATSYRYNCATKVCSNYANHDALAFTQRSHSLFIDCKKSVRTACCYLATSLIAHQLLSRTECPVPDAVCLI